MNYRHAFHAGNHADVFKHIVLTRIIKALCKKETPFAYLDTHAGIGLYNLESIEASKTKEYVAGIHRIMQQPNSHPLLIDYISIINELNTDATLRYYPGSPLIAKFLSRPQDRLILNEKHPQDSLLLKHNIRKTSRIVIHSQDGWLLTKALLPTQEKRAIVLIDPPYEQPDELSLCVTALQNAIQRMRQSIVVIWYPVKNKEQLTPFYQQIQKTNAPTILKAEFLINPADNAFNLNGSGLLIANAPWGLDEELKTILPYLVQSLAKNTGSWHVDWLISENS